MFVRCAFLLIVVQAYISDVLCQQPGAKNKSKQWNDFQRDWNVLMHHIFTKEEENIFANCCGPGQSQALVRCIKGSRFTRAEYEELKKAVKKWRDNEQEQMQEQMEIFEMLQRGKMSVRDLMKKFKQLMVSKVAILRYYVCEQLA
ncbi:uncharacterized protein LOC144119634 [Amblyomma americanum]